MNRLSTVVTEERELRVTYAAFVTYGRGNGNPAGLKYGDLSSYAFAKVRGLPLLYKGEDFDKTDIDSVRRPSARVRIGARWRTARQPRLGKDP